MLNVDQIVRNILRFIWFESALYISSRRNLWPARGIFIQGIRLIRRFGNERT